MLAFCSFIDLVIFFINILKIQILIFYFTYATDNDCLAIYIYIYGKWKPVIRLLNDIFYNMSVPPLICELCDLQADVAYIPFVERFQIVFSALWNYDITAGRPKLAKWIEVS